MNVFGLTRIDFFTCSKPKKSSSEILASWIFIIHFLFSLQGYRQFHSRVWASTSRWGWCYINIRAEFLWYINKKHFCECVYIHLVIVFCVRRCVFSYACVVSVWVCLFYTLCVFPSIVCSSVSMLILMSFMYACIHFVLWIDLCLFT